MSQNPNPYDLERHVAEIYDQQITDTDDVALLLKLIGDRKDRGHRGGLRIFEPFCRTGRILIPPATHTTTGSPGRSFGPGRGSALLTNTNTL